MTKKMEMLGHTFACLPTFQMTRLQRLRTLATVAYDPEDDIDDEALMATGSPAVNTPKAGLDVPEDVPGVICEDVKEIEFSDSPVPPIGSNRSDPLPNSIHFAFSLAWMDPIDSAVTL